MLSRAKRPLRSVPHATRGVSQPAGGAADGTAQGLVKSGRTVLLNARITPRAHDRFHAIIESERLRYERGELMHRVTLGEVVERALAALERELAQTRRAK